MWRSLEGDGMERRACANPGRIHLPFSGVLQDLPRFWSYTYRCQEKGMGFRLEILARIAHCWN